MVLEHPRSIVKSDAETQSGTLTIPYMIYGLCVAVGDASGNSELLFYSFLSVRSDLSSKSTSVSSWKPNSRVLLHCDRKIGNLIAKNSWRTSDNSGPCRSHPFCLQCSFLQNSELVFWNKALDYLTTRSWIWTLSSSKSPFGSVLVGSLPGSPRFSSFQDSSYPGHFLSIPMFLSKWRAPILHIYVLFRLDSLVFNVRVVLYLKEYLGLESFRYFISCVKTSISTSYVLGKLIMFPAHFCSK